MDTILCGSRYYSYWTYRPWIQYSVAVDTILTGHTDHDTVLYVSRYYSYWTYRPWIQYSMGVDTILTGHTDHDTILYGSRLYILHVHTDHGWIL